MSRKSMKQNTTGSIKKKTYRPPRLTRFGVIKDLTAGGSGAFQEPMTMMGQMNRMRFP